MSQSKEKHVDAPIVTAEQAEKTSIFRWMNRRPLTAAFLDQNIEKYSRETFNIIGLSSNPTSVFEAGENAPSITTGAFGFGLGAFVCKPGEGPALHQHQTEEVFMVADGEINVYWMNGDERVEVTLSKYDLISVPIGLYRGFYNSGDSDAIVMAVLGGPEAGAVAWHPIVIEEARAAGVNVSDDGKILD